MKESALTLLIKAQDQASKQLEYVTKKLDKMESATKDASGGFGKLSTASVALGSALGTLAAKGIEMAAQALGNLVMTGINAANEFEKAQLKYETLLGSQEKATKRFEELVAFAARTPFELTQISKADVILQGFGIRSEKLLETIGNAAAISGSEFSDLGLIIGQLSQSKDLENIKQLVERGVVSFDELRNAGIKFAKDGSVVNSVQETYGAVVSIMEKKFKGGMDKLSGTLEGRLSTLKDTISMALGGLMEDSGIQDALKEGVTAFTTFLSAFDSKKFVADVKAAFGQLVNGIVLIQTKFQEFMQNPMIQAFLKVMNETIASIMWKLQVAFVALTPKLLELSAKIQELYVKMQPFLEIAMKIVGVIGGVLVLAFMKFIEIASVVLPPIIGFLIDVIGGLISAAMWLGDAFFTNLNKIVTAAINAVNMIVGTFNFLRKSISTIWNGVVSIIKSSLNGVIGLVNRFIDGINSMLDKLDAVGSSIGINVDFRLGKIPMLAKGARNFAGGMAIVGERGPELVSLPKGSNVYNNPESQKIINDSSTKKEVKIEKVEINNNMEFAAFINKLATI